MNEERKFEVGDKALIAKKVESSPDWHDSWVRGMDEYVNNGVEHQVSWVDNGSVYLVGLHYSFPPEALQLVSAADTHPDPEAAPLGASIVDMVRGAAMMADKLDTEDKVREMFKLLDEGWSESDPAWWNQRDYLRGQRGHFDILNIPGKDVSAAVDQDMYLHLSKCKTMVAYAQTIEKRQADVWTATKFGRYLTKYHPELDNEAVKKQVDDFNYKYGPPSPVKFGETEADFIHAIKDGPSDSCMADAFYGVSGKFYFRGQVHPAAVYAAGDIEVAWLECGTRVTARALCNKRAKQFGRVYGDAVKLIPQLETLGYTQQVGALLGCRIRRIDNENGSGYIMAYVDAGIGSGGGALNFEYDSGSDCFVLIETDEDDKRSSTYLGYDNKGVTEDDDEDEDEHYSCDRCGADCDEDDLTYIESESQSVCEHCLERHYTYAVVDHRGNEAHLPTDETTWVECLGKTFASDYVDGVEDITYDSSRSEYIMCDDAVECVASGEQHHRDDCRAVGTDSGDDLYLHDDHVKDEKRRGRLYADSNGKLFWHTSDEVVEWLHGVGDEGWDPVAYVKCVVAVATPPPAEITPTWRDTYVDPTETRPECPAWVEAYLAMQSAGIRLVYDGASMPGLSFTSPQKYYTIDLEQTFPDNWRDTYRAAQERGVGFVAKQINGRDEGNWLTAKEIGLETLWLDGLPEHYQLAPNQGGVA